MQNSPHSLDEQLQCLTQRLTSYEPLGYMYMNEVYLLDAIEVSNTNVIITMFNGGGQLSQPLSKKNNLAIEDFIAHVHLVNDI